MRECVILYGVSVCERLILRVFLCSDIYRCVGEFSVCDFNRSGW